MPQHHRKQTLGVVTRERERVGVTNAGVCDLDQHFALARRRDVDLHNLQRLASGKGDGGARFHDNSKGG